MTSAKLLISDVSKSLRALQRLLIFNMLPLCLVSAPFVQLIIVVLLLNQSSQWSVEASRNELYINRTDTINSPFRFRDFVPRSLNIDANAGGNTTIRHRDPRGFQFHVLNNDLYVDLEFTMPFVEIPVQKSMTMARTTLRNLVNLNTGALLWSGFILAVGAIVFALVKALGTPIIAYQLDQHKKQSRFSADNNPHTIEQGEPLTSWRFEDIPLAMETKLAEHHIDARGCVQRIICEYTRDETGRQQRRRHNWYNIIDGLASLDMLQPYFGGSPLQKAIAAAAGETSDSCESLSRHCGWPISLLQSRLVRFMLNQF